MNCSVSPTSGQPSEPAGGRALAAVDRAASRRTTAVTSSAATTEAVYKGQETPPAASGCMAGVAVAGDRNRCGNALPPHAFSEAMSQRPLPPVSRLGEQIPMKKCK
uniref:Uncharacterized protein n=1 Tax=Oryza punctata TaxID=4537 RepID=A0A0E0KZJ8_ORYPU